MGQDGRWEESDVPQAGEQQVSFPFKVGDKIRRDNWPDNEYVTIKSVSRDWVVGEDRGTGAAVLDVPTTVASRSRSLETVRSGQGVPSAGA